MEGEDIMIKNDPDLAVEVFNLLKRDDGVKDLRGSYKDIDVYTTLGSEARVIHNFSHEWLKIKEPTKKVRETAVSEEDEVGEVTCSEPATAIDLSFLSVTYAITLILIGLLGKNDPDSAVEVFDLLKRDDGILQDEVIDAEKELGVYIVFIGSMPQHPYSLAFHNSEIIKDIDPPRSSSLAMEELHPQQQKPHLQHTDRMKLYPNTLFTAERFGDLQGLNKQETAEIFGKDQVYNWPRSYAVQPPNGESLEMCSKRVVAQLMAGKHAMVVAHANSLSSIIIVTTFSVTTFRTRYYMEGVGLESESGGRTTRERTIEVRHHLVIRDNVKEVMFYN
ncbi:histidine phosphatase superfamily protein [Tanacetum coccineum]